MSELCDRLRRSSKMWEKHPKLETHAIETLRNYLNEMGVYQTKGFGTYEMI